MSTVHGGQGNIVTNGLILNLDAANPRSYAPPFNGTTWQNIAPVSSSLTGSLINGPTFNSANGGYIIFDGSNDWVEIPTYTFGNGNWTVNTWALGNNINYSTVGNLLSNSSGGPVSNSMGFVNNKIHYRNYTGSWQSNPGNTTLSAGVWYMLTWVNYLGQTPQLGTMKMFVNGLADSAVFNSYTTNGGPCNVIGRSYSNYFNGRIGNIQFYSRSLTDSEILQNFNSSRARFGI